MLYNSSAHVGHALAHVIGNTYHIPHGLACAYSLPVMLEFIAKESTEKVKKTGEILGAEFDEIPEDREITDREAEKIGQISAEAYVKFRDSINGIKSIQDFGVTGKRVEADMQELIRKLEREVFNELCPRKIGRQEAEEILNIFLKCIK